MTENVYYEAGGESHSGKLAVANVVMNRVNDKRFPKTPCSVIKQKRGGICQFSWVCSKRSSTKNAKLLAASRKAAEDVYFDVVGDNTSGAKFFHASRSRPSWSKTFKRTISIGGHVFYKG